MSLPHTTHKNNPHLEDDQSIDLDFIFSLMNSTEKQEFIEALDEAVKTD